MASSTAVFRCEICIKLTVALSLLLFLEQSIHHFGTRSFACVCDVDGSTLRAPRTLTQPRSRCAFGVLLIVGFVFSRPYDAHHVPSVFQIVQIGTDIVWVVLRTASYVVRVAHLAVVGIDVIVSLHSMTLHIQLDELAQACFDDKLVASNDGNNATFQIRCNLGSTFQSIHFKIFHDFVVFELN